MISKTIGYNGVHNIFRQTQIGPASIPKWSHPRCHSDATEMLLWNFLAAHCRSPKCHTEVGENNPVNHGTQFMCEFQLSSQCHVAAWAGVSTAPAAWSGFADQKWIQTHAIFMPFHSESKPKICDLSNQKMSNSNFTMVYGCLWYL